MIPRIRGRVGQADEPLELKGKWFFEMYITELGAGEDTEPLGPFGPWDTEAIATEKLREACQVACEIYEKEISGGEVSGKFIDMKTNQMRRWDRGDEN